MTTGQKTLFFLTILLAILIRFYGIDWDKGYHLHPDERMIIMVADRLTLPKPLNITNLLSPQSTLNPQFFAYGSFPIYLLKASGSLLAKVFKNSDFAYYSGLLYVGRILSVLFDIGTVLIVFKIAQILRKNNRIPLLASFLYTISVLPIQASHFYAVDILLTFLSTTTLYLMLVFSQKPSFKNAAFVGVSLGLALATKITIILLVVPVLISLLLIFSKTKLFIKTGMYLLTVFTFAFLLFTLTMPYAILDFPKFYKQIAEQLKMNSNPYIFPFTLQYVGTPPYLYYLKNIMLWGLGTPLAVSAFASILFLTVSSIKKIRARQLSLLILLTFFWIYFLVVGKSAVKFMRYMLPLYPLFAIFTAYVIGNVLNKFKKRHLLFVTCFVLLVLIWPFSFIQIYSRTHTRLTATYWINQRVPLGSNIGVEHWDDRLPLMGGERYVSIEYPLYEQDNEIKWANLRERISQTDYIILASNRLYVPLQKLTDCTKYKVCYPITARYYQTLFSGELGFVQVARFSSYPKIPFTNIEIVDDSADESFIVYDHPVIYIFKNTKYYGSEILRQIII